MRTILSVGCFGLMLMCAVGCQKGKDQQTSLAQIEEKAQETRSEHFTKLQPLEWLIGTWQDVDPDDAITIETSNNWEERGNFIIQNFSVQRNGQEEMSGQQIIGWDPHKKAIRSWIFDTDGGFAEGQWNQEGANWLLDVVATLPDGRKGSTTYLFSQIKPSSYTWEANDRQIGDDVLENIGPIKIVRKK